MSKSLKNDIEARHKMLSETIIRIEKRLLMLPNGGLSIRHINGKAYYYHVEKGFSDKILGKNDKELIKLLIEKAYLKKSLKAAKMELKQLSKVCDYYPEDVVEDVFFNLPAYRKQLLTPVFADDDYVRKWQEEPYVIKNFKSTDPVFYTLRGERVRSKSEVIIADRLYANGIPYKYECPLKIGNKTIHPDFTLLRLSDLKVLYHEHCGKMDDPEYTEDSVVKRINDYGQAGIVLGDNLFMSFESSTTPLDVSVLDKFINANYK